jgi:hypothetical protein
MSEREPAARVLDAAINVAASAPAKRGQFVSSALIYWPLIEELRAALDDLGIDWKGNRPQ